MSAHNRSTRSSTGTLLIWTSGIALLTVASCVVGDGIRRGDVGDSCTRTDDCEPPLHCVELVCVDDRRSTATPTGTRSGTATGTASNGGGGEGGAAVGGSTGTGGGAAGGAAGNGGQGGLGGANGGAGSAAGPGVGPGESLGPCDDCLDTACSDELWACEAPCIGVEACIETVCRAIPDSGEEGQCQVYCQNAHPGGKVPHLDVVNCAFSGVCFPPCGIYPEDYVACRGTMTSGDCADEWAACSASTDCLLYRDCTSACTTFASCLNCSSTAEGLAGRALLEAYETCIATECVAESWAW